MFTTKDLIGFVAVVALLGGALSVGLWELGQWVFEYLTVGWR